MKLVRNLAAALILACALSVNVYAGDQETPGCVAPPPPTATSTDSTAADKTATTPETDGKASVPSQEEAAIDILVQAVIALISVF
jgi:hypothetical protein